MGSGVHGLVPHSERFPASRDWVYDDIPCRRADCMFNTCDMCVVPSKCIIGEDGRCTGYVHVEKNRDKTGD